MLRRLSQPLGRCLAREAVACPSHRLRPLASAPREAPQRRKESARQILLNRRGVPRREVWEEQEGREEAKEPGPPPAEVLGRVVEGLRAKGEVVVLREGAETGVEVLMEAGLGWEAVLATFLARPDLFQTAARDWRETLSFLSTLGVRPVDALSIAAREPAVLRKPKAALAKKVEILTAMGVHGDRLPTVLRRCPSLLLHLEYERAYELLNVITSFFSREEALRVVVAAPRVLYLRPEDVEAKYEHVHLEMGLDAQSLVRCRRWALLPLRKIMARHEFLVRSGRFLRPNPKRPFLSASNPPLSDILDSPNKTFATLVAKVSHEEWNVFQEERVLEEMYERQWRVAEAREALEGGRGEGPDSDEAFDEDFAETHAHVQQPSLDNEFATSRHYHDKTQD